ncbi:hypothetical protein FXF51_46225 [Nonomuraea sp. PA05]|nr:hypothetical protein FXF51_46225 [Nonomuraea sp. PA05]
MASTTTRRPRTRHTRRSSTRRSSTRRSSTRRSSTRQSSTRRSSTRRPTDIARVTRVTRGAGRPFPGRATPPPRPPRPLGPPLTFTPAPGRLRPIPAAVTHRSLAHSSGDVIHETLGRRRKQHSALRPSPNDQPIDSG